jgi:hypothetical protein
VLRTLRQTFVRLGAPEDPALTAAWAELLPAALDAEPEVLLLQTIARTFATPERAQELGRRAVAAFAARNDVDGEIAAVARLGAVAYALMDSGPLVPHLERVAELAATGHPWAVAFDAVCRGAIALLSGDWRTAEAILLPVVEHPSARWTACRTPIASACATACSVSRWP